VAASHPPATGRHWPAAASQPAGRSSQEQREMSSVPTRVDTERGSPLEGVELTRAQKLTLYRDGFVVLKGVVPRELTRAARRRIFEPTEAERREGAGKLGFAPEITGLLINSPFRAVLENTLGEFDRPISTQVGVTPAGGTRTAENAKKYRRNSPNGGGGDGYNLLGYHEEGFPFYNATIHMDGLTTCPIPQERCAEERTPEEIYLDYIDGPWSEQSGGSRGRHAENYGTNGGMLFQDKGCSLSTGSFSAFAVVCLNDQSIPGRGQFSVLRGAHHAMQSFYRMQMEMGGIVGPEGPGWPRLDYSAPNRCGLVYLPEMVREHFLDAMAEPTPDGNLWPQPTQCLMEEGDVTITLHAIPHSGSRNEGPEPRSNMIWRIRHKKRQPNKVHIGGTDHPDRLGINLVNGEWMEFDQDEPPYFRECPLRGTPACCEPAFRPHPPSAD
jgi:hypothetical protein